MYFSSFKGLTATYSYM